MFRQDLKENSLHLSLHVSQCFVNFRLKRNFFFHWTISKHVMHVGNMECTDFGPCDLVVCFRRDEMKNCDKRQSLLTGHNVSPRTKRKPPSLITMFRQLLSQYELLLHAIALFPADGQSSVDDSSLNLACDEDRVELEPDA